MLKLDLSEYSADAPQLHHRTKKGHKIGMSVPHLGTDHLPFGTGFPNALVICAGNVFVPKEGEEGWKEAW